MIYDYDEYYNNNNFRSFRKNLSTWQLIKCIGRGGIEMQFKTVECDYCHKEMVIQEEYVRQPMFCTLGCMDKSENEERGNN